MKLNQLLKTSNVTAYGFLAFNGLQPLSNPKGKQAIISTLAPAIMYDDLGVAEYFAPVFPRGSIFDTPEEIIAADLDVNKVSVFKAPDWDTINPDEILIVSRHAGTVEFIKQTYPTATVSECVTPEIVDGRHVIGTLPPHLVALCKSYVAITITGFDYSRDGDLTGAELQDRLQVSPPIYIKISE